MVDQSQMEAYRRANHHLEKALRSEIDAVWKALAGGTPEQIRDGLLDTIPALIDKYGKASAELAAEWFEELVGEAALVEDAYRPEAWRASTRWALDPIFKETKDYEAALTRVASVAVRFVRQHGRDVVDSSVRKYPHVLYARVPSGSHTCSFCMILASRGPVYGTKQDAGGPGNRYHTDCDCMVVPMRGRWEPDRTAPSGMRWHGETVDGYDHEKLYVDEYKPYWREGLSLKEVIARRTDANAARSWGGVTWLEDLKDSTAKLPSWWDAEARRKTIIGHPGSKPGQWNGGHGFGQGVLGKTEFPERWSDKDIDLVLAEVWANPTAERRRGDRRSARRVIDGVLVHVEAYGDAFETFRTYYAVGGRGVFYNGENRRIPKRIPRDMEGWTMLNG